MQGMKAIKYILEKALDNNEKLLRSALVGKPLVYFVGSRFAQEYMEKRKKSGIFLKSLRFSKERVDRKEHTNYTAFNKEVRVAPSQETVKKSTLIWDDFVAQVDMQTLEVTLTQDPRYADSIKKWFDQVWEKSV